MDWQSEMSDDDRREWDEFVEHARRNTMESMIGSQAVISLVNAEQDPMDIKFALELGLSIMLDKPIVAVVMPGATIPDKFRLVADHIVEGDIDTEEGREKVALALKEVVDGLR